ncbi:MAG: L-seryl-tRNA(Sec) selenium transferase [Nitrospirae bacterium]|nr:L-seryl-tRNA(Sec) selenium transferase [Nitrospirota bacterium]
MAKDRSELLRQIPSVDEVLKSPSGQKWLKNHPRLFVLKGIRESIALFREEIKEGKRTEFSSEELYNYIERSINDLSSLSLRPVINATGVVIHTNLGRAPLHQGALENIIRVSEGYSNLEYNLEEGKRGKRYDHIKEILKELTGAEDAIVVNNNAAAVLLCLSALARGKEVVVSRGELVEIGGSFRVPDVMLQSGAILREVGTTNKTHLKDYASAINDNTALFLKVHQSNYRIIGFTEDVPIEKLTELGRLHGIPVMYDLGSGCFADLSVYGIRDEPVVKDIVNKGVDIVTFSGDKLLGGPQAGIILGRKQYIDRISTHPLTRAVRIDKLTLSALEYTLYIYADMDRAVNEIPVLKMLLQDTGIIKKRAERIVRGLKKILPGFTITVEQDRSQAGGGSLPGISLQTYVACLGHPGISASQIEKTLRSADPPVISRIKEDMVLLDARTIRDEELKTLLSVVKSAFQQFFA